MAFSFVLMYGAVFIRLPFQTVLMSAHQPTNGFIAQLEAICWLQKCKENFYISGFSLHFCSSEGRNEL
ncbi:MAG: hypothetical protein IK990_09905, partial [Ruminiclostridium sp.]|nr:hypothetical protein [Ruminiclostridium sp.]